MIQSALPWKTTVQTVYWGAERYLWFDIKYSIILKVWALAGGNGELWLRLLSVAAGLAGILFAYLAARSVLNPRAALAAGLMTAICPFHIAFSRTVGSEALLFACCAATIYFFLKIFTDKARLADYFLYFLSAFAAMNAHYTGALVFITSNIVFFSFRAGGKDAVYRWITVNAPLVAVFSVLMSGWKELFTITSANPDVKILEFYHPGLMTPILSFCAIIFEAYFEFFFTAVHFFAGDLLNVPLMPAVLISVPLFHIAFLLGFREYEGGLKLRYYCFIMLGVAGVGATAMTFFGVPLPKALCAAWPVFNIIIAGGVYRFGSKRMIKTFLVTLALLFLGGLQSVLSQELMLPDWRAIVSRFDKLNQNGTPIIILDGREASGFVLYSGKKPRWKSHALFPDFAPIMLENNELLQDQITLPFNGRFDSYQDFIEKQVMDNGEAWILYREEVKWYNERIESEVDWAEALKTSGRAEIVSYKIPGDDVVKRHLSTDGLRLQQYTLSRIIAIKPGTKLNK